jgi:hypothetical protein
VAGGEEGDEQDPQLRAVLRRRHFWIDFVWGFFFGPSGFGLRRPPAEIMESARTTVN